MSITEIDPAKDDINNKSAVITHTNPNTDTRNLKVDNLVQI